MKEVIKAEIASLNNLFKQRHLLVKIVKAENVLSSFVRYELRLHTSQSFKDIESLTRELAVAINRVRAKYHLPSTEVIPVTKPYFALEVDHPNPKTLLWPIRKTLHTLPHTMLLGLSAINSKKEVISFDKTPHTLIAGITGAGKSVLLQMMLISLAYSTSPNELELILVDLKNEDLVPFKDLPHTKLFAGSKDKAREAIIDLVAEKDRRIAEGSKSDKRIVLVIDELAQVSDDKIIQKSLKDLISIGRSKKINIIAATQSVTKDGGLGSMMKSNFTCRLVGKVASGLSAIATGLPGMFAHLLPGKGSFLRIENDSHRFQSFYIDMQDVELMMNETCKKYPVAKLVVDKPIVDKPIVTEQVDKPIDKQVSSFPIKSFRPLTNEEIDLIRQLSKQSDYMYAGKPSVNKLCKLAYGSVNPQRREEINKALHDAKIIKLHKIA